ncbi:hypothetical protein [Halomicrococcus gelatinilyticus]|uniref:hypothetical protein n=1 Tax=Halomicrococcus gelatinilyticus TaxID=1702103 RepID=UPI002E0FD8DD
MVSLERAGNALPLALLVTFLLGAVFSPPDPFTQVVFALPLLVVALPGAYVVLGRDPSRRQHALFVGALWVVAWAGVAALDATVAGDPTPFRVTWLVVSLPFAGWLAYVEGDAVLGALAG